MESNAGTMEVVYFDMLLEHTKECESRHVNLWDDGVDRPTERPCSVEVVWYFTSCHLELAVCQAFYDEFEADRVDTDCLVCNMDCGQFRPI